MKEKNIYQKSGVVVGALVVLIFMFIVFLSFSTEKESEINDENVLKVLDTGKSDCIIIKTEGLVIINDTADDDDYNMISEELDSMGIKKIDYIICSHLDKDHIGSAAMLIENYEIGQLIIPNYETDSKQFADMLDAAKRKNITVQRVTKDSKISCKSGSILISAPQKQEYENENNYSLILDVELGGKKILLMGDALKERTQEFLDTYGVKKYDVIKLPHHGDYYKILKEVLNEAEPELVIFTVQSEDFLEKKMYEVLEELDINYKCTCDGNIEIKLK